MKRILQSPCKVQLHQQFLHQTLPIIIMQIRINLSYLKLVFSSFVSMLLIVSKDEIYSEAGYLKAMPRYNGYKDSRAFLSSRLGLNSGSGYRNQLKNMYNNFDRNSYASQRYNLPLRFLSNVESIGVITDRKEIYEKVSRRATAMKNSTDRVKKNFLEMLGDSDFEQGLSNLRQEWLPEIGIELEEVEAIEEEDAFRKSFQYLQYFAVGLEQIILDQALHEGLMIKEFREIEEHLSQLLCEIQLGMWYREISPERHIGQEVMAQEYRDIGDTSRRMIRDYLLLRDLVKLAGFIGQLFSTLEARL